MQPFAQSFDMMNAANMGNLGMSMMSGGPMQVPMAGGGMQMPSYPGLSMTGQYKFY